MKGSEIPAVKARVVQPVQEKLLFGQSCCFGVLSRGARRGRSQAGEVGSRLQRWVVPGHVLLRGFGVPELTAPLQLLVLHPSRRALCPTTCRLQPPALHATHCTSRPHPCTTPKRPAQHLTALGLHPVLGTLHPAARAPLILHPASLISYPAHCAPCFLHPAPPCWFSTASHCQSWGQVPVPTLGIEPTGASPGAPPSSQPQPCRWDRSRPEATVRAPLPSRQRQARGELSTTPSTPARSGAWGAHLELFPCSLHLGTSAGVTPVHVAATNARAPGSTLMPRSFPPPAASWQDRGVQPPPAHGRMLPGAVHTPERAVLEPAAMGPERLPLQLHPGKRREELGPPTDVEEKHKNKTET